MEFPWDKKNKKEIKVITPEELAELVKFYSGGNKSGS